MESTPMDQNDESPHPNPHQDYKISNSNDSCSDVYELNRAEAESKQIVLITLVSQEPAIFNSKHEDYRNIAKKDELWLAMSKQVGWSDCYCKNKWKAIRDQYCRELKRTRTNCNAKIKWKYFKHLEFLRPYALARNYRTKNKNESNIEDEVADQEESSNTQEETIKIQFSTNDEINSSIKTETWSICDRSDLLADNNDITSQIIMQLSQQYSKTENEEDEEELPGPQEHDVEDDDDDDDPIHTFLNIESYFEKELITLVQKTTVLYDVLHISYRNTRVKSKVWDAIARKLKRPVRQCRSKWKALRDQYIREHKRLKNMGSSCKTAPRWKHYDDMSFLENFVKEKVELNLGATLDESNQTENPINEFEQEEMINLPNKVEAIEMDQYSMMGDDDTSALYTEHLDSPLPTKSPYQQQEQQEQQRIQHNQGDKNEDVVIEEVTEVTEAQSSSNDETDDEVGAFFRAVAIKIRKANMSAVAFTELQIDILKVITNALKD